MIEQLPERAGETGDTETVTRHRAEAAAGQVRNDQAKAALQCAGLKGPDGTARSETMNQQYRLAAATLDVVQRNVLAAHGWHVVTLWPCETVDNAPGVHHCANGNATASAP